MFFWLFYMVEDKNCYITEFPLEFVVFVLNQLPPQT